MSTVFQEVRPVKRGTQTGFGLGCKAIFDRSVGAVLLILASPILATVAAVLLISLGSPVLFRQTRPGRYGKPFVLFKFRTMTNETDANGELLPDGARLNGVGRVIRSLSLDELPQLWNVVRGEISLVGPRPLLMQYLDLYTPEQARRHDVLPGITGWAQVNGRNALSWEQKFELDVWYVDHWSLWLDLKILALTAITVFRQHGISQPGYATAVGFKGTKRSEDRAN